MSRPNDDPIIGYFRTPPDLYTYDEYLEDSADLEAETIATVLALASRYQRPRLNRSDWINYLADIYGLIEDARYEIAGYTRDFLDSERFYKLDPPTRRVNEFAIDGIRGPDGRLALVDDRSSIDREVYERVNLNIPSYDPRWFEEAMEPARDRFSEADAPDAAVYDIGSRALKEVENAARKTALWAVEDDPKNLRWARVEGNENIGSCAFCAMLISRGPVYRTQAQASVKFSARQAFNNNRASGEIPEDLMVRFHPNCDCKVVPVYDEQSWPGKAAYEEMQDLWVDLTHMHDGWDKFLAFRRYFDKNLKTPSAVPRRLAIAA